MKLLGQPHIVKYLTQGIHSKLLSPSLLFVGPAGVGKKTAARELGKILLSDDSSQSDLLFLNREMQAKIIGEEEKKQTAVKIDAIRFVDNFLHLKSMKGGARVVIIDEANLLTDEAANALLKLLEEPPANAHLILIAPDEHQLPVTVVSRCSVLRFRPIPVPDIIRWLHSEHGLDVDTAETIAQRSNGSFSKALQLKDEDSPSVDWDSFTRPEFFEEMRSPLFRKDPRENARQAIDQLIEKAQRKFIKGDLSQQAMISYYLKAKRQIRHNVSPQLVLEELFLKLESQRHSRESGNPFLSHAKNMDARLRGHDD